MQFCGLDSESIGDAEVDAQNQLVRAHMVELVKRFRAQRVRFISLIEGNMSWVVANQIGVIMSEFQPMYHGCKSDKEKLIGVHTRQAARARSPAETARSPRPTNPNRAARRSS